MKFCEKFGWTPAQLDEQDEYVLNTFLYMDSIDAGLKKNKSKNSTPQFRK